MKILIACEYSGIVRDAFTRKGHYAMSCDILPTESEGPHYQGDVMDILNQSWDMMIAHPPCTYLANSGVRWLNNKDGTLNRERHNNMVLAKNFFCELLNAPIEKIAIENPIQHKYGKICQQTQVIQPWMFGEPQTKAICLWLKNLPALVPTKIMQEREAKVWRMPPGPNRQKERSKFFVGVAEAMAEQWG